MTAQVLSSWLAVIRGEREAAREAAEAARAEAARRAEEAAFREDVLRVAAECERIEGIIRSGRLGLRGV
jgi:septal ring factor EnvC (AmiA/AmiB activator)